MNLQTNNENPYNCASSHCCRRIPNLSMSFFRTIHRTGKFLPNTKVCFWKMQPVWGSWRTVGKFKLRKGRDKNRPTQFDNARIHARNLSHASCCQPIPASWGSAAKRVTRVKSVPRTDKATRKKQIQTTSVNGWSSEKLPTVIPQRVVYIRILFRRLTRVPNIAGSEIEIRSRYDRASFDREQERANTE